MGPLLAAATAAAARTRERRGGVAPVSSYAAAVQHNAHNLRTPQLLHGAQNGALVAQRHKSIVRTPNATLSKEVTVFTHRIPCGAKYKKVKNSVTKTVI